MNAYQRARRAFDAYCAMGWGALPDDPTSRMQVAVHRMRPQRSVLESLTYVLYGLGQLAQRLDAPADEDQRERVAVHVRTIVRGLMGLCNAHRLDFGELTRDPPTCRACGGEVEPERYVYAIPTCYRCLPPPAPLPVVAPRARPAPPPLPARVDLRDQHPDDCPCTGCDPPDWSQGALASSVSEAGAAAAEMLMERRESARPRFRYYAARTEAACPATKPGGQPCGGTLEMVGTRAICPRCGWSPDEEA